MVDTLTLYRSPVRLVLHAAEATSPFSVQAISRARKKLMAEIALSGDELVVDDVLYTRNDAATLLDGLTEESWRVHCLIYTYPGLLLFLEKQTFDPEALKKADAYLYDQRFVQAVSPYFAYSFNAVSGNLLRQEGYEPLVQLLTFKSYITEEHQHEAFQKIRNYLDELSFTLRNLSWEKFIADESILHFVFDDGWKKFVNSLPVLFNTLRDEVVGHLIEIVLRFQQKATWYYLHQVLVNLRGVETNDFNRHEIARIDEVIFANTKIESKGGKRRKDDEVSTGRIVWWGIWIVLMIVRAATCNERSSNNYRFSDYTVQTAPAGVSDANTTERKNETTLLSKLDSALTVQQQPVQPVELLKDEAPLSFTEHTSAAINDSLLIHNNTGLDALFLYFKDIPGHATSGTLPKLYTALIRKGQSQRVYVLPGNGRVYFAFGEQWGKLAKPVKLHFPEMVSKPAAGFLSNQSLSLDQFFNTTKGLTQTYLLHPLYVEHPNAPAETDKYRYLNHSLRLADNRQTELTFSADGSSVSVKAKGRLTVKQDRFSTEEEAVPGSGISAPAD